MLQDDVWASLSHLTQEVLAVANDITVVFVANRKTAISDNPDDRATEYMTDSEATEILSALREGGFRTHYYEGEDAFILDVLAKGSAIAGTSRLIVYNVAQSGTDPGRKSLVPAFCALHGLPICNSSSFAVSLARHKVHVHAILAHYGVPTPRTWAYEAERGWLADQRPPEGVKLIAKAAHESASIGLDQLSVGMLSDTYEAALAGKSKRLEQACVVQEFIAGSEVEVPVVRLGSRYHPLGCAAITVEGETDLGEQYLHYDLVAHDDFGFEILDPGDGRAAESGRQAARACEFLGLSGFARVDFRLDRSGRPFAMDVATSPHLVKHSSYWHVFRQRGWTHDRLFAAMIAVNADRLGWI